MHCLNCIMYASILSLLTSIIYDFLNSYTPVGDRFCKVEPTKLCISYFCFYSRKDIVFAKTSYRFYIENLPNSSATAYCGNIAYHRGRNVLTPWAGEAVCHVSAHLTQNIWRWRDSNPHGHAMTLPLLVTGF